MGSASASTEFDFYDRLSETATLYAAIRGKGKGKSPQWHRHLPAVRSRRMGDEVRGGAGAAVIVIAFAANIFLYYTNRQPRRKCLI